MTHLFALLILAGGSTIPADGLYTPPINQPIRISHALAGNVGANGESAMVDLVVTYVGDPTTARVEVGDCNNICNGAKHAGHAQCDLSCDTACGPENRWHRFEYPFVSYEDTNATFDGPAPTGNRSKMSQELARYGMPTSVNTEFMSPSGVMARPFTDSAGRNQNFSTFYGKANFYRDHWNKAPCSRSPLTVEVRTYKVRFDYLLYLAKRQRDGSYVATEKGPSGTMYTKMSVVDPNTQLLSDPIVDCKCEQKADEPKEHGFLPGGSLDGYAYVEEDGKRRPMTGTDISTCIAGIEVPDMNEAIFTPGPMLTATYCFPAGWQLESISGDVQDVQLQDDLLISPGLAGQPIVASLRPANPWFAAVTVRTLCLEMSQPEPRSGQKFRLVPPRTPGLAKLARMTRASRFRGPWDQMRLWIATDMATYAEIRKKLIPSPGPDTYLRELHNVVKAGAIHLGHPKVERMTDLSLLLGENVNPEAAGWLVKHRLLTSPDATIAFLTQNAAKLPSPPPSRPDPEMRPDRLMQSVSALLGLGTEKSVKGALAVADVCHRPAAVVYRISQELSSLTDEAAAAALVTWLEGLPTETRKGLAVDVHPSLPESIRDRMAAFAGG